MFPEQKPESTAVQRLSSDFGALYSSTSVKNWAWNISQEEHHAFHTLSFCVLQLLSDQYGFYPFLIHSFPSLVPRDALFRLCFPATEGKKKIALWKSDQDSYIILEIWAALNDSLLYLSLLKGEMTPSLQAKLFRAIRFWCCPSNPSCQDGKIIGENGPFVFFLQDKRLYHPVSNSCIDSSPSERRVFMNTCDPASLSQQWLFERTNATVLEHFNQGHNWGARPGNASPRDHGIMRIFQQVTNTRFQPSQSAFTRKTRNASFQLTELASLQRR